LDTELVRRGLASSSEDARESIAAGLVFVGGAPALNAQRQVEASESVQLQSPPSRFVGRGGEKLSAALDCFSLSPSGLRVLDAGASTGGFTDCLLQAGAREVVALDVGHSQLHQRIRTDPRVIVLERTNLRHVDPGSLGVCDAVVADLSFISLTQVMGVLLECCSAGGWLVLLVKPQFEATRPETTLGKGVITDPLVWRSTLMRVIGSAHAHGAVLLGLKESPLRGSEGNLEFLLHLGKPGSDRMDSVQGKVTAETLVDALIPTESQSSPEPKPRTETGQT
jgi:23S rRNA (cytidine1920-2'-O)/16S rRNA (cytidine1409-2'-O)-methyltransferase